MRVLARHLLRNVVLPAAVATMVALALLPAPAFAQDSLNGVFAPATTSDGQKAPMDVKAREMLYDTDKDTITAVGEVQIVYGPRRLQADRVVYEKKTHVVTATGNVQITEADGTVTYADSFKLTDDFRDGYIDTLHIETWDKLRVAAIRAERTEGNVTVFHNGVYTACEPCKDDPARPPLWQIKAARIIHNQTEKMIYFEDAHFEFLGMPIAYLPYMSSPDPSVTRKTGLLAPEYFYKTNVGYSVEVPYFINLAPNYDVTLSPSYSTQQGPMGEVEWRHRLLTGSYKIRAAGTYQADPEAFSAENIGNHDFRGMATTSGEFWLNDKWRWGWQGTIATDKYFFSDYRINGFNGAIDATSTLYLTGQGSKSWFDARFYYFLGLSTSDVQKQLPLVHPVIDYDYVVDQPVFGGELGWNANFTSLSREQADYDQVTGNLTCDGTAAQTTRADCLQRGIDGDYSRASINAYWKRTLTDRIGEQWTPFAYVRGDLAWTNLDNSTAAPQFVSDDGMQARGIAAVGLDYRYPFIAQTSWGTQVLEPIAQIILRPRLQQTGQFPNEDAQSFMFDDTNLFDWDKSSGYDRLEDGSRINAGLQYTLSTNGGAYVNAQIGQSYALGGYTPYSLQDMSNTGLDSGLDKNVSDYVGRLYIQPVRDFALLTSARFDDHNWGMQRLEVSAIGTIGPIKTDIGYGRYDAQPELGQDRREGVRGRTAIRIAENWLALGGALYDIDARRFSTSYVGLSYVDQCIAAGFSINRTYDATTTKTDTAVAFRLSLRGLTETGSPEQFAQRAWDNSLANK